MRRLKEMNGTKTDLEQVPWLTYFKGEFGIQKRFPKGESEKSFPPVRCLKIPAGDLMKEEIPDEKITIEDKENIV